MRAVIRSETIVGRKYNDIADWKWAQLLDVLGDRSTKTASHTVNTKEEVDALFSKPEFINPECITLVEVMMDGQDAPRALQMQTEITRKAKVYGPTSDQ
jgi:pyruvate decarboxylase